MFVAEPEVFQDLVHQHLAAAADGSADRSTVLEVVMLGYQLVIAGSSSKGG